MDRRNFMKIGGIGLMGAAFAHDSLLLGGSRWGVGEDVAADAGIVIPTQIDRGFWVSVAPAKIIPLERPAHLVDDDSFLRAIECLKESYHDVSMSGWKNEGVVHAAPTRVTLAGVLAFSQRVLEFYRMFYGHSPIDDSVEGVAYITSMARATDVGKSDPYKAVAKAWHTAKFPGVDQVNERMLEALRA